MKVAESMNKSHDPNVIKKMLKVISQRLQRTHQELADHSEQEDKEFEDEEETPEQRKTRER